MAEFGWIKASLLLTLLLQFTAVISGQRPTWFAVRVGDDVTLPCGNVIDGQDACGRTTWIFSASTSTAPVELMELGQISEKAKAKSDRLNVTASCSLVMKKVTAEDAGFYTCRQLGLQIQDAHVHLSVVSMDQREDAGEVTLNCSVLTHGECEHTVKFLCEGQDVREDEDVKTSQSDCSVAVAFPLSNLERKPNCRESLKCEVTDIYNGDLQLLTFSPQLSDGKTARTNCSALNYIMLAMRVAELLLITVITVLLFRARGNQRPPDDNIVLTVRRSGPAARQVHHDEHDGTLNYENVGDPSASVGLH